MESSYINISGGIGQKFQSQNEEKRNHSFVGLSSARIYVTPLNPQPHFMDGKTKVQIGK